MSRIIKPGTRVLLALLLGALVWSNIPAVAQESGGEATESIEITEGEPEATEAAKPKPPVQPLTRAKVRISDRDPFANPVAGFTEKPPPYRPPVEKPDSKDPKADPKEPEGKTGGKTTITDPIEPPDAPAVTVTGIILSSGGRQAILTSPDQSYVVSVGSKMGEYKVTSITDSAVSFQIDEHTFKVEMEDQWGLRE